MTKFHIIYRKLSELTDSPHNANAHPPEQIEKLKRSISRFGFIGPIVIDKEDQVVCGHGRVAAARALALEEVPTISIAHLSEGQKRAFMIADNKIAEGSTFDQAKLAVEFEAILAMETEIEITDTGFDIAQVDIVIQSQHEQNDEDPADAEVDQATLEKLTRPGDLWMLGKSRLFCGDALDPNSFKVVLGDEKAQMVFTDPPFNCRIGGHVTGRNFKEFAMASGEMSPEQFLEFLTKSCRLMAEFSVDGAIAFICMDWRQIHLLYAAGGAAFDELKALCVWNKGVGGMGSLYRSQHELVAVFKSGTAPHINNILLGKHGRNRTNVWSRPGSNSFGQGRKDKLAWHPTVKNTALVADAILDCSKPGGLILDPFAGSGTLAVAAERTHRRAALIELDPGYCDVILRRFCDVTGIEPVNAATGAVVRRTGSK